LPDQRLGSALPSLEWAVQRRLEDLIAKLETKYGDLRGRIELVPRPGVTFDMIGGADAAKGAISSLSYALRMPDLYQRWGIAPPRGALLYGPPGNGKTLLAKALATLSEALFYHLRLTTLTSKVGPNAAEVIKEVFQLAGSEGKGVIFFDEADALSLEHLLPPERAREAAGPLISGFCELLDGLKAFPTLLVLASTSRPDGVADIAAGLTKRTLDDQPVLVHQRSAISDQRAAINDGRPEAVTRVDSTGEVVAGRRSCPARAPRVSRA